MDLKAQILSFIASILFGGISAILYNLSYKFLYTTKIMYKVLINILFMTNLSLIYFIILLKINNGNINFSFLLILVLSFVFMVKKIKKLKKIIKSKKTVNLKVKSWKAFFLWYNLIKMEEYKWKRQLKKIKEEFLY